MPTTHKLLHSYFVAPAIGALLACSAPASFLHRQPVHPHDTCATLHATTAAAQAPTLSPSLGPAALSSSLPPAALAYGGRRGAGASLARQAPLSLASSSLSLSCKAQDVRNSKQRAQTQSDTTVTFKD